MQGTALKLPHTVQIRVGGDDGTYACCAYCLAADSGLSCFAFGVRLTDKNGEITAAIIQRLRAGLLGADQVLLWTSMTGAGTMEAKSGEGQEPPEQRRILEAELDFSLIVRLFAIIATNYDTFSVLAQICKHNKSTGKTDKIIRMAINMSVVWPDGCVD